MKTHPVALMIRPDGEGILSERATTVKLDDEGGEAAAPIDELRRVLDAEGFYAMCKAANDCPACILTVLRPLNFKGDAESPPCVLGPEDGREKWSYTKAKKDWWAEFNSVDCRSYPV